MVRWIGFHILVAILLAIDLRISHKKEMTQRTALIATLIGIFLALLFNSYVYAMEGPQRGLEFFTAFLIEKSLSIDNLFVFLLIFSYFKVPGVLQHRVLYLGVLGAFFMRLVLILGGVSLINRFHWLTYLMGIIVGITGIRLIFRRKGELPIEENKLLKWIRRHYKVTPDYVQDKFFVIKNGVRYLTPLFLVLVVVESSDLFFALDSIPAVLAVTRDPFIAYTSNVFAVLGLRSLFFLIAPWFATLSRLKIGLGSILLFIGFKMVFGWLFSIPLFVSLAIIATILAISIMHSVLKK